MFLLSKEDPRMVRRALLSLLAVGMASPLLAGAASQKFDWKPVNGLQDVKVESDKVIVSRVEFDLGSTLKGTPARRSSAKVTLRVDNDGFLDQQIGVAIVVFDAEGNVVAAGSNGTKWGYLNDGDRAYYTISFPYLYRRLEEAASFQITLETQGKPDKQPPPGETSASASGEQVSSEPIR
jgi:hypothetical protein